ncbi:adenylyltransferase/cytidyltransferase family protein [Klebsiella pneumoniae subsp. pneumoniae]|nr:adenylyltransferase/cytidyltransferase family protein [Klebsiella pneumoniae subsp. pneumoniae]
MTNGVFDILHAGHVSYLANARKLGDRLIVAGQQRCLHQTSERRNPPGEPAGTADDRAGGAGSRRLGGLLRRRYSAAPDRWHPAGSAGQGRRLQNRSKSPAAKRYGRTVAKCWCSTLKMAAQLPILLRKYKKIATNKLFAIHRFVR